MQISSIKRIAGTVLFAATLAVLAALLAIAGTPGSAGDTTADRVLGQLDFTHNGINIAKANSFYYTEGVAIDQRSVPKHLYVSDRFNRRILGWNDAAAFGDGASADLVIGRPDFGVSYPAGFSTCPSPTAATFCTPGRLSVDSAGNLYVLHGNNTALEFYAPVVS